MKKRLATRLTVDWASIAQWLEHWSCKPGVGSSILPGGLSALVVLDEVIFSNFIKMVVLQVRLELTTPALLNRTVYKYRALTDCATGADRQT